MSAPQPGGYPDGARVRIGRSVGTVVPPAIRVRVALDGAETVEVPAVCVHLVDGETAVVPVVDANSALRELRAEYDQAAEDWGRSDAQVLAENQRLAAENDRARKALVHGDALLARVFEWVSNGITSHMGEPVRRSRWLDQSHIDKTWEQIIAWRDSWGSVATTPDGAADLDEVDELRGLVELLAAERSRYRNALADLAEDFWRRGERTLAVLDDGDEHEDDCDSPAECHASATHWTWKLAASAVDTALGGVA